MTAKEQVRTLLDRLPDDCSLDDVQYHRYVSQALARGEVDEEAGRVIPYEQVESQLRCKWPRSLSAGVIRQTTTSYPNLRKPVTGHRVP